MLSAIIDTLTSGGIITLPRLEQSLRSKALHGGSLALNLVLHGDLCEEVLADAYCRHHGYVRASADELASVERPAFDLVPIEIVYDTGILPLRRVGDARLLVGVVDPSEPERLDEAQFFAGFELEARVITASQMARAFETLAGQPWKRPIAELIEARDRLRTHQTDPALLEAVVALCGVEPDLERRMLSLDLERPLAAQVGARGTEVDSQGRLGDGQPPETGARASVHTRTELVAPADVPPESIVELGDHQRKPELTPVFGSDAALVGEALRPRTAPSEAIIELHVASTVDERDGAPDLPTRPLDALRCGEDAIATTPLRPIDRRTGASPVVLGRSVELPAFHDSAGVERTADGRAATQSTLRLTGVNTSASDVVGSSGARSSDFTPVGGFDVPTAHGTDEYRVIRLPTVDGVDVTDYHGAFGPPVQVFDGTGPPTACTTAAVQAAIEAMDLTEDRDAIARDLVEVLSIVFPTVLVLSLRLPRLLLWDGHARRGPPRLRSQRFDLQEDSVWYRVASGTQAFRGRLATHDPLRIALDRELSDDTIAAPLMMKDRPVAILVLDAGYLGSVPGLAGLYESLERSIFAAFRRAIVQRKRSLRAI